MSTSTGASRTSSRSRKGPRRTLAAFILGVAVAVAVGSAGCEKETDLSPFLSSDASLDRAIDVTADAATNPVGEQDANVDVDAGHDATEAGAAAAPRFVPGPGTYTDPLCVRIISDVAGAVLHYTLDGSPPTAESPRYAGPIGVASSTTVRAIAVVAGRAPSSPERGIYVMNVQPAVINSPSFDPAPGDVAAPVSVRLATPVRFSQICYTLDGALPGCSASPPVIDCSGVAPAVRYACDDGTLPYDGGPIVIDGPSDASTRVRARVCKTHYASEVGEATYRLQ